MIFVIDMDPQLYYGQCRLLKQEQLLRRSKLVGGHQG